MAWGDKKVEFMQTGDGFQTLGTLTKDEMFPAERFVFDILDETDVAEVAVVWKDGLVRKFKRA